MRKGDWIQTFTSKAFWPLDPKEEEIDIIDIAHALSLTCRYGGHCKQFYSVAEHSILVSELCKYYYPDAQLWGLLHDAAEAYISDIPGPLKYQLKEYLEIEKAIEEIIVKKFNIKLDDISLKVKTVDNAILFFEMKQLMSEPPMEWQSRWSTDTWEPPKGFELRYYQPKQAECEFLRRFYELTL